jgi:hypothetical protein
MWLKTSLVKVTIFAILLALILPTYTVAGKTKKDPAPSSVVGKLWEDPGDISSKDLFYGPGGAQNAPKGENYKLISVSKGGTQPSYIIEDEHGRKWIAKVGREAQAETVATRLLWAVGYYADADYYVTKINVAGLKVPEAKSVDGVIFEGALVGARLEPLEEGAKFEHWNWYNNPFVGTKEMNGLKVMMALLNNWDLKKSNNRILFDEKTGMSRYYIHDVGASFGRTGGVGTRSKNDAKDYAKSKFIEERESDHVDFVMDTRPPFILAAFSPTYYAKQSKMETVPEKIPHADARWIGELLSKLSDEQIRDAFRAAHYSPQEIELFTTALKKRIDQLKAL